MDFAFYGHFDGMLRNCGAEKTLDYAVETGFTKVEYFINAVGGNEGSLYTVKDAEEFRQKLEDRGLGTACVSVYSNLWDGPGCEELLKQCAAIAAALGSPYLHYTALPWLRMRDDLPSFEEAMEKVVPACGRIARFGDDLGVSSLYEEQGFYLNGVKRFGMFFEAMRNESKNVGICGDMGNIMFVDEDPEDFFKAYARDIRHVHVKSYDRIPKADPEMPLDYTTISGKGLREVSPIQNRGLMLELKGILEDAGYTGAYAFEMSEEKDFTETAKETMRLLKQQ